MIYLGGILGLRFGEAIALEVSDVDRAAELLWLAGGLMFIFLDSGNPIRCQRPPSNYGTVGWAWDPPRTTCDWGDGPERDPAERFYQVVYTLGIVLPLFIFGASTRIDDERDDRW